MSREETNGAGARWHEVLGVGPAATERDIKAAYRDLAKVWHPDRFTHDPRLQEKAQEKLKEINEAYRHALDGPPPPRARHAPHDAWPPRDYSRAAQDDARTTRHDAHTAHDARRDETGRDDARRDDAGRDEVWRDEVWRDDARRDAGRTRGRFGPWLLAPALVFCATFAFVTPRLLSAWRASSARADEAVTQTPPAGTKAELTETREPHASVADEKNARPRKPDEGAARAESRVAAAESPAGVAARTALPTVSVLIDPTTNQLARPGCPNKLRVTFPAGDEPRAHCDAAHDRAESPPDAAATEGEKGRKGSRLKSFAGRLAAPAKWIRDKASSDDAAKKTAAPGQSPEQD